jgi:hypothetical protein
MPLICVPPREAVGERVELSNVVNIDLMDYIGPESTAVNDYFFEQRPDWCGYTSKTSRQKLVNAIVVSCAEAGSELYCKGWEKSRLCLRFLCSRGRTYIPPKTATTSEESVSKKLTRNTNTTKPKSCEDRCPFNFTIFWSVERRTWWLKKGWGNPNHTGHHKKEKVNVRQHLKTLNQSEKKIATDSFRVNTQSSAVDALFRVRNDGHILSEGQLRSLNAAGRNQVLSRAKDGSDAKTPAQALVDWLQSQPEITYVLLVDNDSNSSLVSIKKPSARTLQHQQNTALSQSMAQSDQSSPQNAQSVNMTNELLGGNLDEAVDYVKKLRDSLSLESGQILLAAAWTTDKERRLVTLYPEVLGGDVLEQTNNEKRSAFKVAGLTGEVKTFSCAHAFLP